MHVVKEAEYSMGLERWRRRFGAMNHVAAIERRASRQATGKGGEDGSAIAEGSSVGCPQQAIAFCAKRCRRSYPLPKRI